ncbi:DNA starvation/stationary phase protection protein Dps [Leptolyngbya sp. NK1-12]|uniref:DNA starvation/stationary phase protection protein Dps n=1 Tax=Leptolyngbya sp. NK1-12 TaxID=2547451 RepID=A0AA97APZ7_9CYAN|nr:DNA starvation/stationary phase protection protein Dps [Leptolyngbya sp. NK1-12]WNZ22593.1 DNA starvation/stationary phase protection protein Dps [Leptolyngbya sp. NK1-12]
MGSNGRSQLLSDTRIDMPANVRSQVVAILNQTLASTLDLKTQVKQAHWNVKGMDFYQLHELFDELASELEEYIDMVAERVTALGGVAMGTARVAASQSELPEYPLDILDGKDHVTALADRYAAYAKSLRDNIDATDDLGDADTADLYTEISRGIDKRLWFLEAHLHTSIEPVSINGSGKGAAKATSKSAAKTAATGKTSAVKAKKTKAK